MMIIFNLFLVAVVLSEGGQASIGFDLERTDRTLG